MSAWAITTANDPLEFDTIQGSETSCFVIDENHFINFWSGDGDDGFVQVFTVNTTTWVVTTAANRLEFDTILGEDHSCCKIDDNHFINFWSGDGSDGFVQAFEVNTSTWAVTTTGSRLEFDTTANAYNSCCQIDSTHIINFWGNAGGYVQVFAVNTSTWAVTTAGSSLKFDTANAVWNSCFKIDDNHFINFWAGLDNDAYVQVFTVNTTTWAVTTAGSVLEHDAVSGLDNSCFKIDTNHFINFWAGDGTDGYVQVFTVNTTTWAVTTANNPLEFDALNARTNACYQIDGNHFINFWAGDGSDGYTQVFEINTSTWAVTTANTALEYDTLNSTRKSCFKVDTNHFINFWAGDGIDGYVQVFTVELPVTAASFIPKVIIL